MRVGAFFPSSIWVEMKNKEANFFFFFANRLMFILPFPPPPPPVEQQQLRQYVFLTAIGITASFGGCQLPATRSSSRGWDAAMRAPPAPSTTAAVCTPSVPPCPISSCVGVRAARRGRRHTTEEPRTAEARVPPPARHSLQEVLSKDCPPKIRIPPAPQTLQCPEVKTLIFSCSPSQLHRPRNAMSPRAVVHW